MVSTHLDLVPFQPKKPKIVLVFLTTNSGKVHNDGRYYKVSVIRRGHSRLLGFEKIDSTGGPLIS